MTIKESIKIAILSVFKHTLFRSRSAEYVMEVFAMKHKGSATMGFLLPIPKVEVTTIDNLHDKWTLVYDDLTIDYIVTWRPSKIKTEQYVMEKIE